MKFQSIVLTTAALLWMGTSANADPIDLDAFSCSSGNAINGVSLDDVTGNNGGSSECFGTFDGNDPDASGDGIETGGVIFDFVARSDINDNGSQTLEGNDIGLDVYAQDGGSCDPGTELSGASSLGCWSYDPSLFSADAFIVVLKAANSPGWAAWLFEGAHATSHFGKWAIGWVANGGACDGHGGTGNCAEISHLTIFASNETVTVPEPGTLGLLGLGLVGFALTRRRKTSV